MGTQLQAHEHACTNPDLTYHKRSDGIVYRITCDLCPRTWNLVIRPANDGRGSIGFWNCTHPMEMPGGYGRFNSAAPWRQPVEPRTDVSEKVTLEVRALNEKRKAEASMSEADRAWWQWQKEGGGKRWGHRPSPDMATYAEPKGLRRWTTTNLNRDST